MHKEWIKGNAEKYKWGKQTTNTDKDTEYSRCTQKKMSLPSDTIDADGKMESKGIKIFSIYIYSAF